MNKLAIASGLALLFTTGIALAEPMTSGRPSAVLSPEQCNEVWKKAVPSGDVLAEKDAKPYIVNFKLADPDNDGTIDKKEFDAACAKGLVTYTNH
jgi:hypothetical protein